MKITSKSIRSIIYGMITIVVIAAFISIEKIEFDQEESITLSVEVDKVTEPSKDDFNMNSQLRFIANQGQAGEDAKYHVQGVGHTVLFYKDKVELRRTESATQKNEIVLQFEGANQNPIVEGMDKLRGVANFYKGSDQSKWQTNVPTFGSVLYKELYPGIDMAYIGNKGELESEFYLSPGADYHQIELDYSGIKSKNIRDDGALVLETNLGELVENTPIAFQEINGIRLDVDVQYALLDDENIGFELGYYNKDFSVVIDPLFLFSRVVEGQFGGGEWAEDIVIDSEGNLIIVGAANRFFPATDNIEGSQHEGGLSNDGVLIKMDGLTGEIISSALLGGSRWDLFTGIAIDATDNIYLLGSTASDDFPMVNAAQDSRAGGDEAFVAILNSEIEIIYSTYLGGAEGDWGASIATDNQGNIYVTGVTSSEDFPVLNAFQNSFGGGDNNGINSDAFVTKFNSTGSLDYSTYFGGSSDERPTGIEVTSSGIATITGITYSENFPLENAYQQNFGGGGFGEGDIFVSRFSSVGNTLIYSTYLGGLQADWSTDIAMDENGRVAVSGGTTSDDFPIENGESLPEDNISDGVLILLGTTGQPVYSIRSNAPDYDELVGVVIDENNVAFAIGTNAQEIIKFYRKNDTDVLEKTFEFEALGHGYYGSHLRDDKIALAGTFWEPVLFAESNFDKGSNNEHKVLGSGARILGVAVDKYFAEALAEAKPITFYGLYLFGFLPEALNKGVSEISILTTVDLYFNGFLVADNINLNAPLNIPEILDNPEIMIEITDSEAPDNSNPLATFYLNILESVEWDINIYDRSAFVFYETEPEVFNSLLKKEMRIEASEPAKVELFIAHTAGASFGMVDLQLVDNDTPPNLLQTLFDDIPTESVTDYISFDPDEVTFQITNADNSQQYGLYSYDLSSYTGQALVGAIVPDSLDLLARELLLFDTLGNQIESIVVSIDENTLGSPNTYELSGNYPNPFSSSTIIYYNLPESSQVSITIYNSAGQEIETLVDEQQPAGKYEVTFNADDLPGGLYFYSIKANDFVSVKKMLLN